MVKRRKNRSWIISNKWFLALNVNNVSKLQCQVCKRLFSYANNTTTAAIRHLSSHNVTVHSPPHNSIAGQSTIISAFLNTSTGATIPNDLNFKDLIVDMLIECKLPFTYVEKPSVQRLLHFCQSAKSPASVDLPSGDTVSNWIKEAYDRELAKILMELQFQENISYTVDLWTSPWQDAFMSITSHWIDNDWKKREVIIGFEHVESKHTGLLALNRSLGLLSRINKHFLLQEKFLQRFSGPHLKN
jgi:hypothetical protein